MEKKRVTAAIILIYGKLLHALFYPVKELIRTGGGNMQYFLNGRQMQAADHYTIQELGIPSLKLMERAAASCVEVMEKEHLDLSRPCVVCGSGNNGGDGIAIARMLTERGCPVQVCLVGNAAHATEETRNQMERLRKTGARISDEYIPDEYSIIVDAVFGVGLNRMVEGRYCQVIRQMNEADAVRFAVDIPSGISADSGQILGIAFRADITVTFQRKKLGMMLSPGREYAGKVVAAEIGIDTKPAEQELDTVYTPEPEEYRRMLPERPEDSNKGTFGKLLVIAGSKGMSGAAYLNAMAAYRCGAGLVQVYTPEENRVVLQTLLPEAIIHTYESFDREEVIRLLGWADAVCIGSGIGTGERSCDILRTVLGAVKVPCLIDADGLNLLAEHPEYWEAMSGSPVVLTPHMKEMSRLLHIEVTELKARRLELLRTFTIQHPSVCILKDSRTITAAPHEQFCISLSGNSAMAKGGAGDVLAGVVAGLMVQGLSARDAAILGVYLHGRAGDLARKEKGPYSVLARDLLYHLSSVFLETKEEV